jgi:hypothetical protein
MRDLARARAPSARLGAGLYESHYLTAVEPSGGRALWLRHTALKRPGAPARSTTWVTWFDRAAPSPSAWRVTNGAPIEEPGADWARGPHGVIGPGRARGALETVSWDLAWESRAPQLPYLPARVLYDRPLPRSGGVALVPAARFSGRVAGTDAAPVTLDDWQGMVGHNWGSEHAEHWSWLHAGALGADGTGWLDLVLVRVRLGPLLSPWIASGALHLDGRTHGVARRGRVRREVTGERTDVAVALTGGTRLVLTITAPISATAGWDYASPSGAGRDVRNCSVADGSIRLSGARGDRGPANAGDTRELDVEGRFAVEHGAPASPGESGD